QQIAVAGSRRLRSRTGGGGGCWRRGWRWRNTASEGLDLGRAGALITDPQRIQGLGRRRTPGITGTYGTAAAVTLAGDASEFRRLGMGVGVLLEKGGQGIDQGLVQQLLGFQVQLSGRGIGRVASLRQDWTASHEAHHDEYVNGTHGNLKVLAPLQSGSALILRQTHRSSGKRRGNCGTVLALSIFKGTNTSIYCFRGPTGNGRQSESSLNQHAQQ